MEIQERHALIIVDIWDRYWPGHHRFQNILEQTENRICNVLLKFSGPVVLSCYNTYKDSNNEYIRRPDQKEPWTKPSFILENNVLNHPNNLVSWDTNEVIEFLNQHSITSVIFAGTSLPGCIEDREIGIENLSKYYKCKVLIDCVVNMTSTGYNDFEIIHDAYRYALNKNLELVTSDSLHLW